MHLPVSFMIRDKAHESYNFSMFIRIYNEYTFFETPSLDVVLRYNKFDRILRVSYVEF